MSAEPRQHSKGFLFLLASALLWSTAGVLIKWVDWPAPAVAGMRALIAAAALLAFRRGFSLPRSRWQWGAALAYAATTLLFVAANKMTTAANAILLQYTSPIFVALFSPWFLAEPIRRADWATIGCVLVGMSLFFLDDVRFSGTAGNLIAIASGLTYAWMTLFMRRDQGASASDSILFGNLIAAAIGLPWLLGAPSLNASGWLALLFLGVFQLGLAYLFYAAAIRRVTALEAVLIPVVEPLLNPLWVLLLVGERPGPMALLGGSVVLSAVTLRAVSTLRRNRRPPPLPKQIGIV